MSVVSQERAHFIIICPVLPSTLSRKTRHVLLAKPQSFAWWDLQACLPMSAVTPARASKTIPYISLQQTLVHFRENSRNLNFQGYLKRDRNIQC